MAKASQRTHSADSLRASRFLFKSANTQSSINFKQMNKCFEKGCCDGFLIISSQVLLSLITYQGSHNNPRVRFLWVESSWPQSWETRFILLQHAESELEYVPPGLRNILGMAHHGRKIRFLFLINRVGMQSDEFHRGRRGSITSGQAKCC